MRTDERDHTAPEGDMGLEEQQKRVRWRQTLRRTLPYLRPYRRLAGSSVGLVLFSALFALLEPWPLALLIDSVLGDEAAPAFLTELFGGGTITLLFVAVGAGFLITAGIHGLAVLTEYVNTKLNERMVLDFRSDLFRHSHRLSLSFHEGSRTGGLMNRIQLQASKIGQVLLAMPPLAQSALTLIGMFVVSYTIDPQLALVSLTVVPFIYYSVGFYMKRVEPQIRRVKGLEMRSMSIIHEAMSMFRVILAFGRETHEYRRFRDTGEVAVDARVKLTVRQTLFSMAVNLLTAAGTALVLGLGAYNVLRGRLSVGQLLVVISYIAAVYTPLETISSSLAGLQEQMIGLDMAFHLLDEKPDVKDAPDAVPIDRATGHIRFENVSFSYDKREGTLQDISFEAKPGQAIAVIGPTGAGKSTLVSLIPRFYDAQEGRVVLDGRDIRKVTVASLREQVSIVLQEPLLFSGTITENIRYGRLDATMEEVVEAAKAANAHDFIVRLPNKYGTRLGERGARLSGGERQRISVARAFLKDAPILVLDEPTSSIDTKTEEVILDALERLVEGRTTFMIAHRLSTVRRADLYLVLDQGRTVERGTHEELLAHGGLYRELYGDQAAKERKTVAVTSEERRRRKLGGLARALQSPKEGVKEWALRSLQDADRDEVRSWITQTLQSDDPKEAARAALVARRGKFPGAGGAILRCAARLDAAERRPFVSALSVLRPEPERLAQMAGRMPENLRAAAVEVVSQVAGPAIVPLLEPLLTDPSPEVRATVVEAFGEADHPKALETADGLMRFDSNPSVRAAASRMLGRVGSPEDRRSWLPYLQVDPAPELRAAALSLLPSRLDDAGALAVIRTLLDDEEEVWREARRFLFLLPDPDLRAVNESLTAYVDGTLDELGSDERSILGRFDPQRIVRALGEAKLTVRPGDLLRPKDAAGRARVSEATLRRWETQGVLAPFRSRAGRRLLVGYGVAEIDAAADAHRARVDGRRKPRRASKPAPAVGSMFEVLPSLARAPAHRALLAGRVLARLAGPEPFLDLSRSGLDPDARRSAVETLAVIGGGEVLDGLTRALSDPSQRVRLRTLELLSEFRDPRAAEAIKRTYDEAVRRSETAGGVVPEVTAAEGALHRLEAFEVPAADGNGGKRADRSAAR